MKNKKTIIMIICVILLMLLIIFTIGRSFGFFRYTKKGETTNIITINGIETEISPESADALNLENAYPISDSEGLSLTPFTFSMTNTTSRNLAYTLKIEVDEEKMAACQLEDGSSCPLLSTNYIQYTYKKDDGSYTEPRNLGVDNNIIATDTIQAQGKITSSIILWIASDAGNEIMNHYFYGKVIVTGEQEA